MTGSGCRDGRLRQFGDWYFNMTNSTLCCFKWRIFAFGFAITFCNNILFILYFILFLSPIIPPYFPFVWGLHIWFWSNPHVHLSCFYFLDSLPVTPFLSSCPSSLLFVLGPSHRHFLLLCCRHSSSSSFRLATIAWFFMLSSRWVKTFTSLPICFHFSLRSHFSIPVFPSVNLCFSPCCLSVSLFAVLHFFTPLLVQLCTWTLSFMLSWVLKCTGAPRPSPIIAPLFLQATTVLWWRAYLSTRLRWGVLRWRQHSACWTKRVKWPSTGQEGGIMPKSKTIGSRSTQTVFTRSE